MSTIKKVSYDVLDEGVYDALVDSVEDVDGVYGEQLKVRFRVASGEILTAWCTRKLSEKSKLGRWTRALLGDIPDSLDTNDLVGRACRVAVSVDIRDNGTAYNRVENVLSQRKTST